MVNNVQYFCQFVIVTMSMAFIITLGIFFLDKSGSSRFDTKVHHKKRQIDYMVTKENATSFLTSKKQSQNMYALEQPGQIKDNYEVLLEQIYIERSICVDLNGKSVPDSMVLDKKTCQKYCESYSCDEEPLIVCGDNTWINYKNSCFKVFNKKLTWLQAQAKCQQTNSNLIAIVDETIQTFISNLLRSSQPAGEEFFIGLKRQSREGLFSSFTSDDDDDDDWKWINGEHVTYTNWNNGEPNDDGNIEDCAELILPNAEHEQASWNDIDCDHIQRKYICEKRATTTSRNKDALVYEFVKFKEISEENVIQFIDLLNEITSKNASTFTAEEVTTVVNVLVKVSNLTYFPVNATKGFFGTINNLMYASDEVYKNLSDVSSSLLKTIDTISLKIKMVEKVNTTQEVKVQVPNIAASIVDLSLDLRGRKNDMWQTLMTNIDETASVYIRANFTEKPRFIPSLPSAPSFNAAPPLFNASPSSNTTTTPINNINTTLPAFSFTETPTNQDTLNRYRLSIVYFKNQKLFQKNSNMCNTKNNSNETCKIYNSNIAGSIVSVNLNTFMNSNIEKESNVVDYNIKYQKSMKDENDTIYCAYWVFKNGGGYWSTEGCQHIGYDLDSKSHKCRCNHTTHYALLFSPSSYTTIENKLEYLILSTLTYTGLALSIIGLLLVIVTYALFKSIRQGIIHKSLIALASCLIMSNYLFIQLTFTKPSLNKIICIITAVLLHYFTLASFMWMLVIAIAQYLTFVKVINNHVTRFMLKASLMAFGFSLIIPITVLILDVNSYINKFESTCWLNGSTLYAAFIAPILLILLINIGFFISVLYGIFNRPIQFKINTSVRRNQIGASICCLVLMGFTWLFGLTLLFNYDNRFINEIIFCVLNTTQGFSICLFHVLLSKAKRDLWSKLINNSSKIKHKQITNSKSNTSNSNGNNNNNNNNNTNNSSNSSNSNKTSNQSTSTNLGTFKQTIKLKINDISAPNMNSNQIILNNNNNIIMSENGIKNISLDDEIKKKIEPLALNNNEYLRKQQHNNDNNTLDVSKAQKQHNKFYYALPAEAMLTATQQHHHYHHHIHHHNSNNKIQIKRKRGSKFSAHFSKSENNFYQTSANSRHKNDLSSEETSQYDNKTFKLEESLKQSHNSATSSGNSTNNNIQETVISTVSKGNELALLPMNNRRQFSRVYKSY